MLGVKELYSMVDSNNLASIKMHKSFGLSKFKELLVFYKSALAVDLVVFLN